MERQDKITLTDEQLEKLDLTREEFNAMNVEQIQASSRCWFSCTESCTTGACETTCTAGGEKPKD